MTKLLDDAVDAIRGLPPEAQDAIGQFILDMVDDRAIEPIPEEHRAAVSQGLRQVRNGEFASDEQVEEALLSFRR